MRRKTPTRRFHLDDPSHSALTRSVAGRLIRGLGTNSDAISAVLEVVQRSSGRNEDSGRRLGETGQGLVDELLENVATSPQPGPLTRQARLTLQAHLDTIRRLALAAELRDDYTGAHIVRVGGYSALIAEKLGLPDAEVRTIYYAAHLHDVGKIGIPDRILGKRGKLSWEEFEIMKTHTTIGSKILADADAEVLQLAQQIALYHHERWDGKGYPQGISAHGIPMAARIVSLADTFDAITSRRPYRPARSLEDAFEIIEMESEEQFDPVAVAAFLANTDPILKIMKKVNQPVDSALSDSTRDEAGSADH